MLESLQQGLVLYVLDAQKARRVAHSQEPGVRLQRTAQWHVGIFGEKFSGLLIGEGVVLRGGPYTHSVVGAASGHDSAAVVVHAINVGDLAAVRAHQRGLLVGSHVEAAHAAAGGGGEHAGAIGREVQAGDSILVLGIEEELVEVQRPHIDHVVSSTGDHAADVARDRQDGSVVALEDTFQLCSGLVDLEHHATAGAHLNLLESCV